MVRESVCACACACVRACVLTEVEEVPRQGALIQVIVGEVQHLQGRQGPEAPRQPTQTVHAADTHTHTHTHQLSL